MKKLSKVALSLLGLAMLAGCNGGGNSSAAPSSVAPSSVAPTSSVSPSSQAPSSKAPSSSAPASSSKSSTSSIYDTKWSKDIVDAMVSYLSQVLPYVDLGKNVDFEYEAGSYYSTTPAHLDISGDKTFAEIKDDAKKAFEDAGWTTEGDDYTLVCTNDEYHLTVTFADDSDMECCVMKCVYDEPFDPTTKTAWSEAEKTEFATNLDGHEIPFIYLGTANNYLYWSSYSMYEEIYGGKYDDSLITLAETAFTNAEGWTYTEETASNDQYDFKSGLTVVVATKTFDDGCTLTIKVGKSYYGKSFAVIYIDEKYNPDGYTWPSDIMDNFNTYFHNHGSEIPNIYLGTKNPYGYYYSSSGQYSFSGKWDDQMWVDVKKAMEDAQYKVEEKTDSYYGTEYVATKTLDDGCVITLTFYKDSYSDSAYLYITIAKGWDPTTLTAWTQDVLDTFEEDLNGYDGDDIPFVYMGTDEPSPYYYSYSPSYVSVTGETWNDKILDLMNAAYSESDGWTHTTGTSYNRSDYKTDVYTKDMGDGNILTATLDSDYYGHIVVKYAITEKFDPTAATDWTDDAKETIKADLNGFSLPFFYMGKKEPSFYYSSYSNLLQITGGTWNDQEYELFLAAYNEASGWTVTSETVTSDQDTFKPNTTVYTATKESEDGYIITVKFGEYYSSSAPNAYMTVSVKEKYDPSKYNGWSKDITDDFAEYLDSHNLPDVYIGARDPSGEYEDYYKRYEITGGEYCQDIIDALNKAYGDVEWTITEYVDTNWTFDSDYKCYQATKKFEDGCTITVVWGADYYNGNTFMFATIVQPMVVDESITDWPTSVKSGLATGVGSKYTIPYFWTNTKTPTLTDSYSTYITGGNWNEGIIDLAKAAFENDAGWTVTVTAKEDTYYQYGSILVASKDYDDGKTLVVTVQCSSDKTCYVYIELKDTYIPDETMTSWGEDYEKLVDTNMGGQDIPYFYIGSSSEISANFSTYGKYIYISGGAWDNKVVAQFEAVYKTEDGWTETKKGSYYGTTYYFTRTLENGDSQEVIIGEDYDGLIYIDYTYYKKYVVDTTVTDWDETTKANIEGTCNKEDIPFFYMGSNLISTKPYPSTNYGYTYTSVTGDAWSDDVVTQFKAAYKEEDGWTVEEKTSYDGEIYYLATKTNTDGSKIEVELYESSYGFIDMYVYYYAAPSESGTSSSVAP